MSRKTNLYNIELWESQCLNVRVVAPSKKAAKEKLRKYLEEGGMIYAEDVDGMAWSKQSKVGMIEVEEEDTDEKDWIEEEEE